jgi:excisionase family DNA binding protein
MKTTTDKGASSDCLLTLRDAAGRLRISLRGLYRLIASGELPTPVKVGRSARLYSSDIDTYLEQLREQRSKR